MSCTAHQNIIRMKKIDTNEMGWARSTYWGRGDVHTGVLWENLRPLGRTIRRWEDNIKMDV